MQSFLLAIGVIAALLFVYIIFERLRSPQDSAVLRAKLRPVDLEAFLNLVSAREY
jgi:hypothetical protein